MHVAIAKRIKCKANVPTMEVVAAAELGNGTKTVTKIKLAARLVLRVVCSLLNSLQTITLRHNEIVESADFETSQSMRKTSI